MSEIREALPPPPPTSETEFPPEINWINWPKDKINWSKDKINTPKDKINWPKDKINWPKKVRKYYEEHIEKGVIALHAESRPLYVA